MSQPGSLLLPDTLFHYYERAHGPFRSLSDLPVHEAEALLQSIREQGVAFASQRPPQYLAVRRKIEQYIRETFAALGGRPRRATPHYLILGASAWIKGWYVEGGEARIPLAACDPLTLSFTYGDSMPAMRYRDGKPYRGQVYTLAELPELVARFGLPQIWNANGFYGPERYIEAQLWDDAPIAPVLGYNL